jgi:ribose 5-phosphate isomerase B
MSDPPSKVPTYAPIALGSDHLGHPLKEAIKDHLQAKGIDVVDFSAGEAIPIDYPDVAVEVARAVAEGRFTRAVLVCGTGIGMSIAANKVPGVRAANVADPYSAERARKSNDAQILCLGSRVVSADVSRLLIDHWLAAEFGAGESARKVAKLEALDGPRRVNSAAQDAADAR